MTNVHDWKIDRRDNVPVVFRGTQLVGPPVQDHGDVKSSYPKYASLFLTEGGVYILHANKARSFNDLPESKVHIDVGGWEPDEIISACGGYYAAQPILKALGKATEERVE